MRLFEEIQAYRPERREGKTVTWLYTQVIASIARLTKDGHLDLEDYIHEIRKAAQTQVAQMDQP